MLGVHCSFTCLTTVLLPHCQLWTIIGETATHFWCKSWCFVYVWSEGHREPHNKVGSLSLVVSWYKEGSEVLLELISPPIIPVSNFPPFSLSLLHTIPWNSCNSSSEMGERHIWVGSIIQINRKQKASSMEDFE